VHPAELAPAGQRGANWKLSTLRRCVPAWNTRPYRFTASASSWLSRTVMLQGFSQ